MSGNLQMGTRTLCLPPQVASVDRKVTASALATADGVQPSFDFFRDILGPVGQAVAPVLAQAAPAAISGLLGMI